LTKAEDGRRQFFFATKTLACNGGGGNATGQGKKRTRYQGFTGVDSNFSFFEPRKRRSGGGRNSSLGSAKGEFDLVVSFEKGRRGVR